MPITNFMGGKGPERYHTDNVLASGFAYHLVSGCLLGLSLLSVGLGSVLVWAHNKEEQVGCNIGTGDEADEDWMVKVGGAGIGIGLFFMAVVFITWQRNWDFVSRFQQQEMQIVASSRLTASGVKTSK